MNTNMIGFRWFSKIFASFTTVLWTKVASALEGLNQVSTYSKKKQIMFSLSIFLVLFGVLGNFLRDFLGQALNLPSSSL